MAMLCGMPASSLWNVIVVGCPAGRSISLVSNDSPFAVTTRPAGAPPPPPTADSIVPTMVVGCTSQWK